MFNNPIKHTRLTSIEELLKFSYRTDDHSQYCLVATQNNGQIAFSNEHGEVFVTPYRPEIWDILREAGYREKYCLFVPFSDGEDRPEAYQWLSKIAKMECMAETHEEAYKVASEKGIQPVKLSTKNLHIREITYYDDGYGTTYSELVTIFLLNNSKDNIGTYIIVDEKLLIVCDEYGRTWMVKVKTSINDLVNKLIDAGYTHTTHPEWYIHHYEPTTSLDEEVIE